MTTPTGLEVAAVASAGFAAVAAGASWVSVLQTRKERIASQRVEMWIRTAVEDTTSQLSIHLHNYGAPARDVVFAVAVADRAAYGYPAPSPVSASGESRILDTDVRIPPTLPAPGFVAAFNTSASKLYVVWTDGKRKVYPASEFTKGDLTYDLLLRKVAPDADLGTMRQVRFLTRPAGP